MKSIRIKNLRSLRDTGEIPIKPITLLIGENSSGKSTFLRSLLLLQQSIDSRTRSVIAWWVDRDIVDFGDFKSSLFAGGSEDFISFGFQFDDTDAKNLSIGDDFWLFLHRRLPDIKNASLEIHLRQYEGVASSDFVTILSKLRICNFENEITIEFESQSKEYAGQIKKILINNTQLDISLDDFQAVKNRSDFIPTNFLRKDRKEDHLISLEDTLNDQIYTLLIESCVNSNTGKEKIISVISKISFEKKRSFIDQLKKSALKFRKNTIDQWDDNSAEFQPIKRLIIAINLLNDLDIFEQILVNFIKKVSYSRPIRANPQRSYRSQDLAIDHIDPRGDNLAVFLRNLNVDEQKSFEEWCTDFFGFAPKAEPIGGHIALNLTDQIKSKSFNLIDVGFGYTQILPVITQLWNLSARIKSPKRREQIVTPITFAIEQPELHLHPKMQSRLAKAFVETIKQSRIKKLDVRMILETHSEAIVNQIGRLISIGELSADDVSVVLFERNASTMESKVSVTQYDNEGFLENWPIGFFDSEDS